MDPDIFCQLGHFNLLLEDYSKGESVHVQMRLPVDIIWQKGIQINEDMIARLSNIATNCLFPSVFLPPSLSHALLHRAIFPALSAYQRYFTLQPDYWKVSWIQCVCVVCFW